MGEFLAECAFEKPFRRRALCQAGKVGPSLVLCSVSLVRYVSHRFSLDAYSAGEGMCGIVAVH